MEAQPEVPRMHLVVYDSDGRPFLAKVYWHKADSSLRIDRVASLQVAITEFGLSEKVIERIMRLQKADEC
jgi:hypothetical protein